MSQKLKATSYDPDGDDRTWEQRVNDGARGIYEVVTGAKSQQDADWAWANRARDITKRRHRLEAESRLRRAGFGRRR